MGLVLVKGSESQTLYKRVINASMTQTVDNWLGTASGFVQTITK